jgi:predicted transcriptional regulator
MAGRTREEAIFSILDAAAKHDGASRTSLMFKSYLSFSEVREVLSLLQSEGLVEYLTGEMKFKTTEKGLQYLAGGQFAAKACSHQCTRCGVIYCCDRLECLEPFQHGKCSGCLNVAFQSSFG